MDTKPLEEQAESFIRSQLLKFDFKVHELSFDEDGSDLMIAKMASAQTLKFVKIQCKGRTVKETGTSVSIPAGYVTDNFLLFLYLIDSQKQELLLLFFPENIRSWKLSGSNEYVLTISLQKLLTNEYSDYRFDQQAARQVKQLLNRAEPKQYTSVFIDGIFLEKVIHQTGRLYADIYPDKELRKPIFATVVKNILQAYNKFKTEESVINCYLYYSASFSLESMCEIDYSLQRIQSAQGNPVRLIYEKSDTILSFDIIDEMERQIQSDNVLLVANDRAYEHALAAFKERGFDLIVIRSKWDDGTDMAADFPWGDICYPIGLSLGLGFDEL